MKTLRATAVLMGTALCAERLEIRNRQEPTGTWGGVWAGEAPPQADVFCRVEIRASRGALGASLEVLRGCSAAPGFRRVPKRSPVVPKQDSGGFLCTPGRSKAYVYSGFSDLPGGRVRMR